MMLRFHTNRPRRLTKAGRLKVPSPSLSVFLSWRMSLKRVSNRESFQSSSTERSVRGVVREGGHAPDVRNHDVASLAGGIVDPDGQVADAQGGVLLAVGGGYLVSGATQGRRFQRSLR